MNAKVTNESAPANVTTMELRSDRALVISRTFNAPPRIVFDAWTRADLVKRWWAPSSHCVTIASCEADVRKGGKYRYVLRQASGEEIGFSGEYTEVTPHSRLVYTQIFEPMADAGAVIITVTFEDHGGKTRLISHEVYPSKEAREAALGAGMEHGMRETMDQLDALVASL
ncbi:MAG TPA: SRPBCC family protein [Polyangiaceae bacterium]|nr:SRPBCC family protein [Polyangiaceae bacterium]